MKKWIKIVSLFLISNLVLVNKVMAKTWGTNGDGPAEFQDLEEIFGNILGIVISLAGIAVFIMLIVGGFKFLTAGGNPENAAKAKGVITWAIVGLIIMLMAWFVLLLIKEVTGVEVTVFTIPTPAP